MGLVLPTIEAYQVQHLPIVKAYADKIGLVEAINQLVPTEMAIDPGTIVLGMILDAWPCTCSLRVIWLALSGAVRMMFTRQS